MTPPQSHPLAHLRLFFMLPGSISAVAPNRDGRGRSRAEGKRVTGRGMGSEEKWGGGGEGAGYMRSSPPPSASRGRNHSDGSKGRRIHGYPTWWSGPAEWERMSWAGLGWCWGRLHQSRRELYVKGKLALHGGVGHPVRPTSPSPSPNRDRAM